MSDVPGFLHRLQVQLLLVLNEETWISMENSYHPLRCKQTYRIHHPNITVYHSFFHVLLPVLLSAVTPCRIAVTSLVAHDQSAISLHCGTPFFPDLPSISNWLSLSSRCFFDPSFNVKDWWPEPEHCSCSFRIAGGKTRSAKINSFAL